MRPREIVWAGRAFKDEEHIKFRKDLIEKN